MRISETNASPDFLSCGLHALGLVRRRPAYLVQSCIGLSFEPEARRITITEPVLPCFLDEVVLRGLAVDGRKADIALRRSNRNVVVDVLDKDGSIRELTSN